MKVFISWSGQRSRAIALALREWLPLVIQSLEPWMSEEDIEAGDRWGTAVATQLETTDFGIICLTPENTKSEWLLFEAGALSRSIQKGRVVPLLFDIELSGIRGPLAQFQGKRFDRDHMLDLIKALNVGIAKPLSNITLEASFDAHWNNLKHNFESVADRTAPPMLPKRTAEEILEELVERIRAMPHPLSQKDAIRYFDYLDAKISRGNSKRAPAFVDTSILEEPEQKDFLAFLRERFPQTSFLVSDRKISWDEDFSTPEFNAHLRELLLRYHNGYNKGYREGLIKALASIEEDKI